jgi:nucleoside-diphosphate-sugar epimerase
MRVLVVGCGYVGLPLASEFVREGHHVVGIRRSAAGAAELRAAGIEPLIADISRPDFTRPTGRFDWVIFTAAPGRNGGPDGYRSVYLDGTRHLLSHLAAEPPAKYIYTGSTSVYAQQDGSVVKESSPTEPECSNARILLETERLLMDAAKSGFPAVILRVAGIYGTNRSRRFEEFLRNEVKIPGQGLRYFNMIHRDDVVGAILAALRNGRPGEVYNVVDQEPVTEIHFYTWLAETLGKWVPPFGPEESDADRRRAITNKKVSCRRLTMELGYRLKYPNFRQGYTAEIKRLTDAGLLEIKPEPR